MSYRHAVALLSVSCCLVACGKPGAAEPGASGASEGAEAPEGLAEVPAPPADDAPAPTAVPETVPNTPEAAQVVPVADPIAASGDIYSVVLDSPRMRILLGTWKPGQTDKPHGHPPLVAYALTDIDAVAYGASGEETKVQVKAGQAFFQNALESHTFKNVGKKKARALIVELKQGADPQEASDMSVDAVAASPEVYRRVFEDQHIRVLHAAWEPGKMDLNHGHPGLAAYFLTDINAKLHGGYGQTTDITRKAGEALFQKPVRGHTLENVGTRTARMVLFEPKALGFGKGGALQMPVESGNGEVNSYVNPKTGVLMDIGEGFTMELAAGTRLSYVASFARSQNRPSSKQVGSNFSRHGATLVFNGEGKLDTPAIVTIGIRRMPTKAGQKFMLAMEYSGECKGANRRYKVDGDGDCSHWKFLPTEFDEKRNKVIAKISDPGGYRLQFGWLPE